MFTVVQADHSDHIQVSVWYDLSDPCIAVCHPTVLALFSDNFDIEDMDTLTAEIVVDSTIYIYEESCGGSGCQGLLSLNVPHIVQHGDVQVVLSTL